MASLPDKVHSWNALRYLSPEDLQLIIDASGVACLSKPTHVQLLETAFDLIYNRGHFTALTGRVFRVASKSTREKHPRMADSAGRSIPPPSRHIPPCRMTLIPQKESQWHAIAEVDIFNVLTGPNRAHRAAAPNTYMRRTSVTQWRDCDDIILDTLEPDREMREAVHELLKSPSLCTLSSVLMLLYSISYLI